MTDIQTTSADQEPITDVIFRRFRNGNKEVIAFFPYLIEHNYRCESYMRIGQHSAADYSGLLSTTRPANMEDEDVKALKRELEASPYNYRFNVTRKVNADKERKAREEFNKKYR
jgi:hypothetical protein